MALQTIKYYFIVTALLLSQFMSFSQQRQVDSIVQILKNVKHDTTRANLILELSSQLYLSKPDTIIPLCLYALAIVDKNITKANKAERYSYLKTRAAALSDIGYTYENQGNLTIALDYYGKSLLADEDIGDQNGIAETLRAIGNIHDNQGNIPRALEYYDRSLKTYEKIADKLGIAKMLLGIGLSYKNQGDILNALDYYNRSLKLSKEIGYKKGISVSLNNIGAVYKNQGDPDRALDYYSQSLKITEEIGNKEGIAILFNNIGSIFLEQGNTQGALDHHIKALKIAEEIDDAESIATSYNLIGSAYIKLGTAQKNSVIKKKNYLLALVYADSSLTLSKEIGFPDNIGAAELLLSNINSAIGNSTAALGHYKQYIIYRDSLNNKETRKAGIKNQLKYVYEKKAVADSVRVHEEKKVISAQLKEEKTKSYALYGGLALVLVFAGFMVNRFQVTNKQKKIIEIKENETHKQNEIISRQKHLVEEKHKEITDSINYAERIQRSFIATKEILNEGLTPALSNGERVEQKYFVLFKPKDVVSGDFYWASKLSNGNFALATADSTGHGVPGAIMSLLNITSLEKAIETLFQPAEILNATRKTIIERLKKDGSEHGGKDGMDASLTVYDFKNKKLIVAAANNPVWIVRTVTSSSEAYREVNTNKSSRYENSKEAEFSTRTDTKVEVIEIKADKMPVGKHDRDTVSFTQQEIDLQTGDVIYTLTDGFPDQFGGEKGKKFMSKNLRELICANAHLPMHEQKELLELTFKNWVGDLEQVDDVTLIGVRI